MNIMRLKNFSYCDKNFSQFTKLSAKKWQHFTIAKIKISLLENKGNFPHLKKFFQVK
jgi:hypothetical protein